MGLVATAAADEPAKTAYDETSLPYGLGAVVVGKTLNSADELLGLEGVDDVMAHQRKAQADSYRLVVKIRQRPVQPRQPPIQLDSKEYASEFGAYHNTGPNGIRGYSREGQGNIWERWATREEARRLTWMRREVISRR